MASIFTITEEDLFNFESFCDIKYSDANCQKYGFFKVKLAEDCAQQCSSLDIFFKQFGVACQQNIRKTVFLLNPQSTTLYGHQNVQPTPNEKDEFIVKSMDLAAFRDNEVSPNCCMQALQASDDTFLDHFYSKVTACPKVIVRDNKKYDQTSIRNRAIAKQEAYKNRQLYENATSMEGKKRCLEMAMLSEEILESSSRKCRCDTCSIMFSFQPVPESSQHKEDVSLLYSAGIEENQTNFLYLTNNFAMAHLCFKNMLADLDSVFGGVSFPALYMGGQHSCFPLHTEDLRIMIPPTSVSRLTDALQRRGFYGVHRWCRNTLNHKFYIPNPQFLKEENIPFEVVFQHEGEGIVVLPNTAHTGGNLGKNLAQACNFGSIKWIPYGCVSPNCVCMEDAVHADLSDLVAVHEPTLLQSYLANDIPSVIEDEYFKMSIVVPNKDITCRCGPVSPLPVYNGKQTLKRRKVEASTRVKCPVCEVSWAYVQKRNMIAHIVKHHSSRQGEEIVKTFVEEYSLPIN